MKLLRHLKEKRYLILAFTLPAILLALAIVFLQPAHNHAKSSSSTVEAASQTEASSTPAVASTPTPSPSSAQEAYQAPQYSYVPPTTYTESHSESSSYTAPAYSADVSSGTTE